MDQVETGSAVTWKYPSCILRGDHSRGEFYSIAITNHQRTDTAQVVPWVKLKVTDCFKGISAGFAQNTYRGQFQCKGEKQ